VNTAVLTYISPLLGLLRKIISVHGYEQDHAVGLLTLKIRGTWMFRKVGMYLPVDVA
jgi:hypothetical protein